MSENIMDSALVAKMFLAGAKNLESKKEWINELNVFPVPDGDTGTNMTMTIMSAAHEVSALEDTSMKSVAKAMSSGSLRGARGNSGVILSQLLRGFCKGIREYDEIDTQIVVEAFSKAVETAYKAVMKPKEGTILTVARGFSEKANELYEEDPQIKMEDLFSGALMYAKEVLEQTPDMLPVLKEAGVVDSGGQGLVELLIGAFNLFSGKETAYSLEEETKLHPTGGYCTEFILTPSSPVTEEKEEELTARLSAMGEELFILADGGIVKVHIHTEEPGNVISTVLGLGTLSMVKIEALSLGHREKVVKEADRQRAKELEEQRRRKKEPRKPIGFISVSVGEGLGSIFRDLGVDCLIEGGQTMNPSTEDLLNAIEQVNADTVFVFPNNKNIILAATQAQTLTKDKEIIVIPTKTIPQGITAMINYQEDLSCAENEAAMYEEIRRVHTCQLTYAVRDTHIDDKTIHEGDFMGVGDKGILGVGNDLQATCLESVSMMMEEDSELISIYYGSDVQEADAQKLLEAISEKYPDMEVELNFGGQPIYYYIISVE